MATARALLAATVAFAAVGCAQSGEATARDADTQRDASGGAGGTATPDVGGQAGMEGRFPKLFIDLLAPDMALAGFAGASNDYLLDLSEVHAGGASLRVSVPSSGYTGATIRSAAPHDLSPYNALTFWAKASAAKMLNVVGLGNDSVSTTFLAEWKGVALTTSWTKYLLPLPLSSKLTEESGLFHFAEGAEEGAYTIWFDDIQYESIVPSLLGSVQPSLANLIVTKHPGDTFAASGLSVTFSVNGASEVVTAAPSYFAFASSAPTVATVDAAGTIAALTPGSADISAYLGDIPAAGTIVVNVSAP
jgi:hypothetical protein